MKKRLVLIAVLFAIPILAVAAELIKSERVESRVIEWVPANGPADLPASLDPIDATTVQGLTVHEWGTFTSVAGPDGHAIEWLPAGGPSDLPCFVNRAGSGPKGLPPTQQAGRANRALVRMETPVLYFYAPHEETVDVKVSFPHGLLTEWFPSANLGSDRGSNGIFDALKAFPNVTTTLQWNGVKVLPGATQTYPMDEFQSHYYAARRTGSLPLQVGKQSEKFLFYRGIASFMPPLTSRAMPDGKVEIGNSESTVIPDVVLFENRGGKIGYRIYKELGDKPVRLDPPILDATFASLQRDLEAMLREQGMYPLEARAMVDTWRDSWFEKGTRVFYIVPSRSVDAILPLDINPKPMSVERAFVGRMEVFTPTTLKEVRKAADNNDRAALETYGRYLEPILHDFLQDYRVDGQIGLIRADYVAAVTSCEKRSW